jgi:hypothetical protein
MVMLELNDRFPSDGMTEQAWESGVAAFVSANPHPEAPDPPHPPHTK